jgi:lipid-A-disaccharide synthase
MLEAASILLRRDPTIRLEVSAASEKLRDLIAAIAGRYGLNGIPIGVRHASELMQRAFAGMVASGTATMEAAFFRFPFVLLYKVSWLTFVPGRLLVKVNYLGMPNILAAEPPIIPEFIQHEAVPERIADSVWSLYSDDATRTNMIKSMDEIILQLAEGQAGHRAAEVVLRELGSPAFLL